jgi:hypothetical protein
MSKPLPCTACRKPGGGPFAALRLAQELGAETATLSDPSEEKPSCTTPANITSAKS